MMAERNQKVFDRVRQELTKNTSLGSRDLYEIAKKVDEAIGGETLQQFHARYVLPLRREQSGGRSGGTTSGAAKKTRRGTRRKAGEDARPVKQRRVSKALRSAQAAMQERQKARAVLLRFAQEFAMAETKAEIIKVMGRLDDYVEQLVSNNGD
jgi:hypothetical protein